jgi:hypothetical protein
MLVTRSRAERERWFAVSKEQRAVESMNQDDHDFEAFPQGAG